MLRCYLSVSICARPMETLPFLYTCKTRYVHVASQLIYSANGSAQDFKLRPLTIKDFIDPDGTSVASDAQLDASNPIIEPVD